MVKILFHLRSSLVKSLQRYGSQYAFSRITSVGIAASSINFITSYRRIWWLLPRKVIWILLYGLRDAFPTGDIRLSFGEPGDLLDCKSCQRRHRCFSISVLYSRGGRNFVETIVENNCSLHYNPATVRAWVTRNLRNSKGVDWKRRIDRAPIKMNAHARNVKFNSPRGKSGIFPNRWSTVPRINNVTGGAASVYALLVPSELFGGIWDYNDNYIRETRKFALYRKICADIYGLNYEVHGGKSWGPGSPRVDSLIYEKIPFDYRWIFHTLFRSSWYLFHIVCSWFPFCTESN